MLAAAGQLLPGQRNVSDPLRRLSRVRAPTPPSHPLQAIIYTRSICWHCVPWPGMTSQRPAGGAGPLRRPGGSGPPRPRWSRPPPPPPPPARWPTAPTISRWCARAAPGPAAALASSRSVAAATNTGPRTDHSSRAGHALLVVVANRAAGGRSQSMQQIWTMHQHDGPHHMRAAGGSKSGGGRQVHRVDLAEPKR